MAEGRSNKTPAVLVLEDDVETLDEVCETLADEGFHALRAETAGELWKLTEHNTIDLFLLDLNLPDGHGLDLASRIRRESDVGIIIVTGKSGETDRIIGLEVGADDYVTKPFSPRELLARVRSVLRRTKGSVYPGMKHQPAGRDIVEFVGWRLDLGAHRLVAPDGGEVDLTTAEFELLRAFVESPNRVLSRDFLLDSIHGREWAGYDRGVDGLVSRLRRKIKLAKGAAPLIKTVRGAGYLFTPNVGNH